PVTGVVRQWSMPPASSAAATVSPARACTGLPSTVRVTAEPASPSLLNMEPPRAEGGDQRLVECATGDHGRDGKCVIGCKRHARMAADREGTGMGFRLVVDRETVLGHDADGAPGAHHVGAAEQGELAYSALGLGGADAQRQARGVRALLLGIADHHRALV